VQLKIQIIILNEELLKNRKIVYEKAKANHPNRWSGNTRKWNFINEVHLNPRESKKRGERGYTYNEQNIVPNVWYLSVLNLDNCSDIYHQISLYNTFLNQIFHFLSKMLILDSYLLEL